MCAKQKPLGKGARMTQQKPTQAKQTNGGVAAQQSGLPTPILYGQGLATTDAPDFLRQYMADSDNPTGLEGTDGLVRPPRLKIVQKMSAQELLDQFSEGDVILMPQQMRVAEYSNQNKRSTSIIVIPIFFFSEYICWNPITTRGQLDAIRERTFDHRHTIAIKAGDANLRNSEVCPEDREKKTLSYVHHMNFVSVVLGNQPWCEIPLVLSFQRSDWKTGSQWLSMMRMRRAPMWSQQFELYTRGRANARGSWAGFEVVQPNPQTGYGSWVTDPVAFEKLTQLHNEFEDAFKAGQIQVDRDDADIVDQVEANSQFAKNPDKM